MSIHIKLSFVYEGTLVSLIILLSDSGRGATFENPE